MGPAAEASSGEGGAGLVREVFVLGGALLGLTLALWFSIGWVVEWSLPLISIETERKVFGSFQPPAIEDSAALPPEFTARRDRAAAVLAILVAGPGVGRLDYRLHLVPGREPNAFAFPGGAIGVTRSLLDLVEDDVALAFVLGHELGHFAHRDHLRGIGRQLGRSLIWVLIFGNNGGDLLSSHVSALLDLSHSRSQESAADRFGLELVHRCFGTTNGTDRLFVWLEQREKNPAWLEMLQTHPEPRGRLVALRAWAAELSARPAR